MDSLTQLVLGAAVGEAVLGKKVGNRAILWGAVAGTIPDLDVFSKYFTDQVTSIELHRGFSHSILFSVIFAPIFGWLISKIHYKLEVGWKDWTKLMFWGLFTHPLLDAHTAWGTQLFWPFEYRLAYKNIFVADPMYTIPFLICVIAVMFYHRESRKRKLFNRAGLLVSSTYMLITIGLKWLAYPKFIDTLKQQQVDYIEVKTRPTPLNSILWSANVMLKEGFLMGYYSLLDNDDRVSFSGLIPKNHHLLGGMANEKKVKQLIKISEGWYAIEQRGGKLIFNDLRFGQNGIDTNKGEFVFSFELFYKNGILQVVERSPKMGDGIMMLRQLGNRILGN